MARGREQGFGYVKPVACCLGCGVSEFVKVRRGPFNGGEERPGFYCARNGSVDTIGYSLGESPTGVATTGRPAEFAVPAPDPALPIEDQAEELLTEYFELILDAGYDFPSHAEQARLQAEAQAEFEAEWAEFEAEWKRFAAEQAERDAQLAEREAERQEERALLQAELDAALDDLRR